MNAYHADSSELVDKEILTWQGFGDASRELAQMVVDSGFASGPSPVTAIGPTLRSRIVLRY